MRGSVPWRLDPARARALKTLPRTLGRGNSPLKEQVPLGPVGGLGSATWPVRSPSDHSQIPLTPDPKPTCLLSLSPALKLQTIAPETFFPRGVGPSSDLPSPRKASPAQKSAGKGRHRWEGAVPASCLLWLQATHSVRSSPWSCRASPPGLCEQAAVT